MNIRRIKVGGVYGQSNAGFKNTKEKNRCIRSDGSGGSAADRGDYSHCQCVREARIAIKFTDAARQPARSRQRRLEPTDVPTEEPTDPPTVPPVTETKMYVKINSGSINLREGQSADTAKLAEIAKGEIVTVLLYAEGADSWSQISYGDKTGYVKTSFLAELPARA